MEVAFTFPFVVPSADDPPVDDCAEAEDAAVVYFQIDRHGESLNEEDGKYTRH